MAGGPFEFGQTAAINALSSAANLALIAKFTEKSSERQERQYRRTNLQNLSNPFADRTWEMVPILDENGNPTGNTRPQQTVKFSDGVQAGFDKLMDYNAGDVEPGNIYSNRPAGLGQTLAQAIANNNANMGGNQEAMAQIQQPYDFVPDEDEAPPDAQAPPPAAPGPGPAPPPAPGVPAQPDPGQTSHNPIRHRP